MYPPVAPDYAVTMTMHGWVTRWYCPEVPAGFSGADEKHFFQKLSFEVDGLSISFLEVASWFTKVTMCRCAVCINQKQLDDMNAHVELRWECGMFI
jgi:hypothetical protein